jgi:hypothetical protein
MPRRMEDGSPDAPIRASQGTAALCFLQYLTERLLGHILAALSSDLGPSISNYISKWLMLSEVLTSERRVDLDS